MARYDDLNTRAIAYTTFVSSVILLVIILLARALTYSWIESEDERKLAEARYVSSDQAISEQKAMLNGYKKVQVEVFSSPEDGQPEDGQPENSQPENGQPDGDSPAEAPPTLEERVHIPLEKAKELLLREHASDPST